MAEKVLPVESCWQELASCINNQDVILVAPPGAGKSTYLPLKLLQLPAFSQRKIIMLQPRQVAVRSIAQYLAQQLGEPVGKTIGYRMRGESKVSDATRLEIITEGLLTRLIQSDPELNGIGLVIFDEFHERNVHADFALALCLEIQQGLRSDMRLLIMSATLNVDELLPFMPNSKLLQSEGRSYPVSIHYRPLAPKANLITHASVVVLEALSKHTGNILVFMTGAKDIRALVSSFSSKVDSNVDIYPLYGDLSKQSQFEALADTKDGRRKIVVATNIAETSLTIDGISVVVDSGKEKFASFNFQRKLPQLMTVNISKASSVQRAGRAGRLCAGHCYRLWSNETQQRLVEHRQPQILESEISGLMLEALIWGSRIEDLALLTPPSKTQIDYGYQLLESQGAINKHAMAEAMGRDIAKLGCDVNLASLLLNYSKINRALGSLACVVVAILEGKSIYEMRHSVLLSQHIEFLLTQPSHPLWREAKRWASKISIHFDKLSVQKNMPYLAEMLALTLPSQVARRRPTGGYQLSSGTGANLPYAQVEQIHPWLTVAKQTLATDGNALIRLAEPIEMNKVLVVLKDRISTKKLNFWDQDRQKIVARERQFLGEIILSDKPLATIASKNNEKLLIEVMLKKGLANLQWTESVQQLINKVNLAHSLNPNFWPDFSTQWLTDNIHNWLSPYLVDVTSWQQLISLNWHNIFSAMLDWSQQKKLDTDFPATLKLHSNLKDEHTHKLTYSKEGDVSLNIKITQIYGQKVTPSIAQGKITVTLNLLSPANRSLHITQNLADFWQGSYKDVQKEMKGRYPKHYWPDDPSNAQPTSRTKKFM